VLHSRIARRGPRALLDRAGASAAGDLLAPVYGWFAEGFGTADLLAANALLDTLQ
jgi:hypothetical protein